MSPKKFQLPVLILSVVFLFNSCNEQASQKKDSGPEYNPAVSAFTSGLISSRSTVRLRLSSDYPGTIDTNTPLDKNIFLISPNVDGNAYWVDSRTIEFRPDAPLLSGTEFKVEIKLSKLLNSQNEDFKFSFNTIPLSLNVDIVGMKSYSKTDVKWNTVEGNLLVSDVVGTDDIEQIVVAVQDGRLLPVSWDHSSEKIHHFTIDSVLRSEAEGKVDISWNGDKINLDLEGAREYKIPALGDFIFMESKIIQQPEQYISLLFSDPINSSQSLAGLIYLSNNTDLKFSISDNEIRVYPNVRQYGQLNLNITPGIKNILGYKYTGSNVLTLNFEELKPGIRLLGEGVILPESNGLLLPFEAVNLKAVDVKIIKIYENNIAQFLQINTLNGGDQLKRAGRLILKKTVDLVPERAVNLGQWNAFSLDLTELIKPDPASIYRVELSFRRKHSLYPCGEETSNDLEEAADDFETINENDMAYWDADNGYYDYNYEYSYYRWNERDDPCTDSYYNYYNRKVSRNILASNLGIIAKEGQDKSMIFAITDLLTAEPLSGVKLEIYNFQEQLLASLTTDSDGVAVARLGNAPFLLIARHGDQRGYLNFKSNYSLPLSQFDVSGSFTRKGIKGFIYGERGVWRPGDSIYISFILEDRDGNLPEDYPVSFEFRDPQGKLRQKQIITTGVNSFYSFRTATDPDDPTGSWSLKVSVGGVDFFKYLKVETVKPNRLKIKLDFGKDRIDSDVKNLKAKLSVKWLHGAVARNLKTVVEVNFKPTTTSFKGFNGYSFSDQTKEFTSQDRVIFDSRVDENGETQFDLPFNLGNRSRGMLNAVFTTRAFEEGGNFSIDQFSIPYSPYPAYIGVKKPEGDRFGRLVTDSLHNFNVVTLTEEGEPVSRKNIEVRVFKLNWRWWWHSSSENLASYTGNPEKYSIFNQKISTGENGKGSFKMKIDYPDWGRFLVYVKDPESGHSATQVVYFDWPGWAGRSNRSDPQAASILPFSSDKTKYNVGETATISIPSSGEGRIFLSIENGTKVIDHYWIKAVGEESTFSFTVTEDMTPNVFVNVSLIQPHAQTKNDLPIRMFGVIPIMVEDPATHISPVLNMDDILKPETTAKIRVSEKDGREMTYTIAIVDEGLLDLTRFKTPEPWYHFYAKEALGVKTYDLYNYVIGAYGGRIDGVFAIGGDMEEESESTNKKANRFPPMVKFEGPFHLKKGKSATHDIRIPNYIGSVRTMLIAGQDGAYGTAEKTTPVRKPLMVISTLPRVLGPGETVSLPVTVFAMEDFVKKADIKVTAGDLVEVVEMKKSVQFDAPGDQTVDFKLKIKEKTGVVKIRVEVSSGSEKAYDETEIVVRSSNPEVTQFIYGSVEPGESMEKKFNLPGMEGTNSAIVEVFSIPPFDFGRRLKYLIGYPHGCIEQTTSAAFPQLYLTDVMETDERVVQFTENNVREAIKRLSKFALPSGGFGYWPESTMENEWATTYVGHFMTEAKEKGYDIPGELFNNWLRFEKKMAKKWSNKKYESTWHKRSIEMQQAYRLYCLALAGKPEIGLMNRLREMPGITNMAKWYLTGAYALAGQEEAAREMLKQVSTQADTYNTAYFYTYGSSLRDQAIMLDVMNLLGEKDQLIPVLQYITDRLSSTGWYSTQTTAYCLGSISRYLGKNNTSKQISFDYKWEKAAVSHAATLHPVSSLEKDFGNELNSGISISNKGKSTLFCRISLSGTPLPGNEQAYYNNMGLSVSYRSMDGKSLDISRVEQGTDFLAVVKVKNPGNLGYYKDIALTQIFPSGWEIQNMRMFEASIGNFSIPEYQDIRDDRIYRYMNLYQRAEQTFAVKLTAAYEGRFYLPGVSCEAMYRNDIAALVPGKWVEVIKPGGE